MQHKNNKIIINFFKAFILIKIYTILVYFNYFVAILLQICLLMNITRRLKRFIWHYVKYSNQYNQKKYQLEFISL